MGSWPGFLGPASKGQSYMADAELSINWYLERNESPSAPNPWAMLPCPGFNQIASVSQAPAGRGSFYQNGRGFFVSGYAFYELFFDGINWTTTQRGTVNSDSHPVTISANGDAGNQLWITSGGVGYIFDLTTNTLSVQGVAGTTVTMGAFLSARFLYLDGDTGTIYASKKYDGTTWDPTMLAQSESGAPWRALVVTPDDLIHLLGEFSSETWADTGAFPFPFTKVQEGSSPYGIVAPFAWAVDTALSFVAQNQQGRGIIVRTQGYTPTRISTHAIETTIQGYSDLSDTIAWKYQEHGHSTALFTFPTGNQTWAFDASVGLWHERAYWSTTTGAFSAYRPGCMMEAFNKIIVGDRLTGSLYEMKSSYFTDVDGAMIRRVRQAPRLSADQKRITINSLQLVQDVGQGLSTGQGSDPQMMVRMSKDGGQTFGSERWASAGRQGEWNTRVVWRQFGQARNFVPQFIATDPCPWPLVDLLVDYTVGVS